MKTYHTYKLTPIALLVLLAASIPAGARTCKWDGESGTGIWSTAAGDRNNWDTDDDPDASDDVLLDNSIVAGSYTVTIQAAVIPQLNTLTITPTGPSTITLVITGAATLPVDGAVASRIQVDAGGTFSCTGAATVSARGSGLGNGILNNGTFTMSAGTLQATDDLDIQGANTVSLNTLTVDGGTAKNTQIVTGPVTISGNATVTGTLTIPTGVNVTMDANCTSTGAIALAGTATLTVKGDFNATGTFSFGGGNGTLRLQGSITGFPTDGNFTETNGLVEFSGTTDQTMPGRTYWDVLVLKSSASDTFRIQPECKTIKIVDLTGTDLISNDAEARHSDAADPADGSYTIEVTAAGASPTVTINGGAPVVVNNIAPNFQKNLGGTGLDVMLKAGAVAGDMARIEVSAAVTGVDAHIDGNDPADSDDNFGASAAANVAGKSSTDTGDDADRFLLEFDVSPLPANVTVTDAFVRLYYFEDYGSNNTATIGMFKVNVDWAEGAKDGTASGAGESDWVDRIEGDSAWTSAGCQSQPADRDGTALASVGIAGGAAAKDKFYDWSGAASFRTLVRDWRKGTVANYGVIFAKTDNQGSPDLGREFRTSDHATKTQRPSIVVKYSVDAADVTVTAAADSTVRNKLTVSIGTLDLATTTMTINRELGAGNDSVVEANGTLRMNATAAAKPVLKLADGMSMTVDGRLITTQADLANPTTRWPEVTSATASPTSADDYTFLIQGAHASGSADLNGLYLSYGGLNGLTIGNGAANPTVSSLQNIYFGNKSAGQLRCLYIRINSLNLSGANITFTPAAPVKNITLVDLNGSVDGNAGLTLQERAHGAGAGEANDEDDDADEDGIGDDLAANGAVIQWVYTLNNLMTGFGQGFPSAAIDFTTFLPYARYYITRDLNAAGDDRLWRMDANGDVPANPVSGDDYFTVSTANGNIVGPVWWETASATGAHFVYFGTDTGKVYKVEDNPGNPDNLTVVAGWPKTLAGVLEVTSPVISSGDYLYYGARMNAGGTSNHLKSMIISSGAEYGTGVSLGSIRLTATPSLDLYTTVDHLYAGSDLSGGSAHLYRADMTNLPVSTADDNSAPTDHIRGLTTLTSVFPFTYGVLFAGSDDNKLYGMTGQGRPNGVAETDVALAGWPFTSSADIRGFPYMNPWSGAVFFGNSGGNFYQRTYANGAVTGYPLALGAGGAIESGPYIEVPAGGGEVAYIGNNDGQLFVIDVDTDADPAVANPSVIRTYNFGTGNAVSAIARDQATGRVMVGLSKNDATDVTKRVGWMIEIDPLTDDTPAQ